jgi:hypothetical protein
MAFWGVLDDRDDAALQAAAAGLEMQIAMFEFNRGERIKEEIVLPPVPLAQGIGINTGLVCAGNIGGDQKIEFTVIGQTVNEAARIEATAGRGQVFLGAETHARIAAQAFGFTLPPVAVKGVEQPLKLVSLRGILPPPEENAAPRRTTASLRKKNQPALSDLLFCLPCTLCPATAPAAAEEVAALVTGIQPLDGGTALLLMQVDAPLELSAQLTLKWNIPEKPRLPELRGRVERRARFPQKLGLELSDTAGVRTVQPTLGNMLNGHAASAKVLPTGALVLHVEALPDELRGWLPGVWLASDLRDAGEIVRI